MTKITFIGTGEAFDPHRVNASYLIENKGQSLLVDCGYDVPKALARYLRESGRGLLDVPDTVLLTHEHGDHCAGLPALLMPMWEELAGVASYNPSRKQRNIQIMAANPNLLDKFREQMELFYSGFFNKFSQAGLNVNLMPLSGNFEYAGLKISSALTTHSTDNHAYRFDNLKTGKSFAISGDGAFSETSRKLYQGVDLLIHEGFQITGEAFGGKHASAEQVVNYAIFNKTPSVAITHVHITERGKRSEIHELVEKASQAGVKLFFPEDHQTFNL